MKNCPKMAKEKFLRECYFFHRKDSSFNPRIIRKIGFLIGQEIWVENSVFAIQHIENRNYFTEVLPPSVPELILLHTAVFLNFTHYIKMA